LAKLEAPEAFLERPLSELPAMPAGITEHLAVERSGAIDGFPDWPGGVELPHDLQPLPFDYAIQPESDINTADVVYCARIPAIMASGERRFLRERLLAPLSEPLVACLATQHRRLYYFANASREEKLHIRVQARFCAPAASAPSRVRTVGHFLFRTDVHRASDGVLMSSSLVDKALRVPGQMKSLLTESERLLGRMQVRR
jgi:probable biosynthetic protein (TIGR04098 family)